MLKCISQISLINYSLHYFITKCNKLLQNATIILFQIATKVYYKMCQVFYYSVLLHMRQSFQKCDSIAKCGIYNKTCQYNASKQNDKNVRNRLN